MFLHEPAGYGCPFCLLVGGEFDSYNAESDVFFRDSSTVARISPTWWPRNPGHALVMPVEHVENIYSATPDAIGAVFDTVRRVAVAIRETYGCEGTSIRQHNEPAGNQDVWHLHVHVFPRWADDDLYRSGPATFVSEVERAGYSTRLRHWFDREG